MSRALRVHPAERVDLEDFVHGTLTFPRGEVNIANMKHILDKQSRIVQGFRIEIPDQSAYPGRIVVHGGYGLNPNGQRLFDEDYLTVSRTITLEGASANFYIEVEFVEVDADSDARAFWDPTVVLTPATDPSGDPRPLGQEFSDTIATRLVLDWKIATPINSSGFARDTNPLSTRLPVAFLQTNAQGQVVTGTEKAATTILAIVSTAAPAVLRVQDAQHFMAGTPVLVSAGGTYAGIGDTLAVAAGVVTLTDAAAAFLASHVGRTITIAGATTPAHNGSFAITGITPTTLTYVNGGVLPALENFYGTWSINIEEAKTVQTTDVASGTITLTGGIANFHSTGEILRGDTAAANFLPQRLVGRYSPVTGSSEDLRDRLFQGDELHGSSLSQSLVLPNLKSDINVTSLKEYVDFLAAQIEELKWGAQKPTESGTSLVRVPPGLRAVLPSPPRYFDQAGGVQGARIAAVTVGDGIRSWGDFNGSSQAVLQAAHDALPTTGGRIFLKRGRYILASDFNWTNAGSVVLEGEEGSVIVNNGGRIHVATAGSVSFKNLTILGLATHIGILVDTANPVGFEMTSVLMQDAAFNLNADLPTIASFRRCWFWGLAAAMAAIPLFAIVGGPASTGTISGTFTECDFNHWTMLSATCALIDCINASPTQAMYQANFVDCSFTTALVNVESIHLGATSNIVHFDRCLFFDWLTFCHIRATGGSNLRFTNCVGLDAFATFFQGTNVSHVEVSGYLNNNSVGLPAVELINCNYAKIRNCDVNVNSIASLTVAAFSISTTAAAIISDVLIDANTIRGDNPPVGAEHPTGVIFNLNGAMGTTFSNIRVTNNSFDSLEAGIYFANSGVAGVYRNVGVETNQFYDRGTGAAAKFKVGVLFGSVSAKSHVMIIGNSLDTLNPGTTAIVGAAPRSAICVLGTSNSYFDIKMNSIKAVGSTGFEVADTSGIIATVLTDSSIVGNTISFVRGVGAFGIRITDSLLRSVVSNNNISFLTTIAGGAGIQQYAIGINSYNVTDSSMTGNVFSNMSCPLAGIAIGHIDSAATWKNVSITGNTYYASSVTGEFMQLDIREVHRLTVSHNTMEGLGSCGIWMASQLVSIYHDVTIQGNTFFATNGLYLDLTNSSLTRGWAIIGNVLHGYLGINGINLLGCSIIGNIIVNDGDTNNINLVSCTRLNILGNYVFNPVPAGVQRNVILQAGCDIYNILENIADRSGGAGVTIDTTLAVPAGTGIVTNNLLDAAGAYRGGENVVGGSNPTF